MLKKLFTAITSLAMVILLASPAAADQWRDEQYWLDEYGFTQAWETTQGEGVIVGVIDTGIDGSHQDLKAQVIGGHDPSGTGETNGTTPMGPDPNHGTMVASLIAGHGHGDLPDIEPEETEKPEDDESKDGEDDDADEEKPPEPPREREPFETYGVDGVLGTAPKAKLLSVSVNLDDSAAEVPPVDDQIAQGMKWLVDQGADVINISLASSAQDWPTSWDDAFLYAEEHDVVVVVAAGNRATGSNIVGAPATIPGVLTVAGLNRDGQASWEASTEGITIGVAAPANPLVGALPNNQYMRWSGTSGAAPLVSGLAALIRAQYPTMPAHQVIQRILVTTTDPGEEGKDNLYGHGIIDANAAVTADVPEVENNPMGSIAQWITLHRRAEIGETETDTQREVAGPAEYATEIPQAANLETEPSIVQPIVVLGFGTILMVLLATAWYFMRKQTRNTPSS